MERSTSRLCQANPGKLNYPTVVAASPHFMSEAFRKAKGIDMMMVPYKTTNDATGDVVTGRVEVMFTTATAGISLARSGKGRLLAVTGKNRAKLLPEVPSMAELGMPSVDPGAGYCVLVAKATPKPIVAALNAPNLRKCLAPTRLTALPNNVYRPRRSVRMPNVPTVAEPGLSGYEAYSLTAPKGTPQRIVDALSNPYLGEQK